MENFGRFYEPESFLSVFSASTQYFLRLLWNTTIERIDRNHQYRYNFSRHFV